MEESKGKKFMNWMQDSMQAIIIIIIALLVLFFLIYSYSKKSNNNQDAIVDDKAQQEEVIDEITSDESNDANNTATAGETIKVSDVETSNANSEDSQSQVTTSPNNTSIENTETVDRGKGPYTAEVENNNTQYRQDGSITVTANYRESLTHLARKATAQYISENNVEGLTPAHKVYVEDALQRSIANRTVTPGTSVSFSNASINSAIQSAKSLNNYQIQNLGNYANHVSGL